MQVDAAVQNALFNQQIAAYEQMLSRVLHLHAESQENYQREVVLGQQELDGLMKHVQQVVGLVARTRSECRLLREDIGTRAMSILRKVRQTTRIKVTWS